MRNRVSVTESNVLFYVTVDVRQARDERIESIGGGHCGGGGGSVRCQPVAQWFVLCSSNWEPVLLTM